MTDSTPPPEDPAPESETTTTTERKPRRWPWIAGIAAALVAGLGIGAAGGETPEDNSDEIADLQAQVERLESGNAILEADLSTAETNVEDARALLDEYDDIEADLREWNTELEDREAELDERETGLDDREVELTDAEDQKAANSVRDGVWTVGVDIEAGTYRAVDVSSDCYWAVLVSGSNGSDIVDNGIPGGGNPTVTVDEGQDFESARCGEWTKQ